MNELSWKKEGRGQARNKENKIRKDIHSQTTYACIMATRQSAAYSSFIKDNGHDTVCLLAMIMDQAGAGSGEEEET